MTNLSLIDWLIVIGAVVGLRFVSLSTRRYMKGVADFLSANRAAGRYLLTIAGAMGGTATVSIAAQWEMVYSAGLPPIWWGFMNWAATAVILLSGWVYYRFRETRALTLAQFFEMRYSRRFRIFSGFLAWTCGVLNFGIFPAVAARFIIYFCGLPEVLHVPGTAFGIPTFPLVMAIDLGLALTFVTMGGQISVMVTECVQGILSSFAVLVVVAAVMLKIQWPRIVAALSTAPANASMLNPYHTSQVKDFNVWFFLILIFAAFYGYLAWQGTAGFNSSARTPHEQKMGGIIGVWRGLPLTLFIVFLPVAAIAVMRLPDYAHQAAAIRSAANSIDNQAIRSQMMVPIVLAHILPAGIKGLLAMVMIFFSFTAHDTYMHSWGSIFIQDVYMPIKNRVLSPQQHIRLLRRSIIGVAAFAFLFGLFYQPTQKIMFFFAITGTVWMGGAGACIIGGLYWRKGTTAAAYTALILGAVVGAGGLVVDHIYKDFPINGQYLWFMAMVGAILSYIVVSLLTCRRGCEHNMEKLLHRGPYAADGRGTCPNPSLSDKDAASHSHPVEKEAAGHGSLRARWHQLVGITDEFSLGDKVLAVALIIWNFGWFFVFLIATAVQFAIGIDEAWWPRFWHFYILLQLVLGVPATIWFTIGGVIDIKGLFRALATAIRDQRDDGRVLREPDSTSEESTHAQPLAETTSQAERAPGSAVDQG